MNSLDPAKLPTEDDADKPLPLKDVFISILASFIGVQKSKNQKRDFARGRPMQFIIVGVVLTVVWYVAIYLIVKLVLKLAT